MTAITIDALGALPCPFCGGTTLHIETDSEPGTSHQVICDNQACEAEGPNTAKTSEEAVRLWNSRSRTDLAADNRSTLIKDLEAIKDEIGSYVASARDEWSCGPSDESRFQADEDKMLGAIDRAISALAMSKEWHDSEAQRRERNGKPI